MRIVETSHLGPLLLAWLCLGFQIQAQTFGEIDPTFHAAIENTSHINSLQVQPDGRLLLNGSVVIAKELSIHPIVRLLPNGDLDNGFSPNLTNLSNQIRIVLRPDGRIRVLDNATLVGVELRATLRQLHADGTLGTAFSILSESSSTNTIPIFNQVVPQKDGKTIVCGYFPALAGKKSTVTELYEFFESTKQSHRLLQS